MNKSEFNQAVALAKSDLDIEDSIAIFDGFGLSDFQPVACTLGQMARLIRYQCSTFAGTWDAEALSEIWHYKARFIIADPLPPEDVARLYRGHKRRQMAL